MVSLNKALLGPDFLGGVALGGVPLYIAMIFPVAFNKNGYEFLLLMVRSKSGINSPVEGTVVEIPLFTTGFSTIPGGCLGFQPSTVCFPGGDVVDSEIKIKKRYQPTLPETNEFVPENWQNPKRKLLGCPRKLVNG